MSSTGFHVFETAIGFGAVAWGEGGITGVFLPDPDRERVRAAVARKFDDAAEADPPQPVAEAIEGMRALMRGEAADLTAAPLDLTRTSDFHRRVYDIARAIPAGAVMTYGEIATRMGDRLYAREVGQALGKNPFPIIVPCHRVLAANGKTGGFSAPGGVQTKMKLLSIERARVTAEPSLFDDLPLAAKPAR